MNHIARARSYRAIDINFIIAGLFVFFIAISLSNIAAIGAATIASVASGQYASQFLTSIPINIGMTHTVTGAIGTNSHNIILFYYIFQIRLPCARNNIAVKGLGLSIQIKHSHIAIQLFASIEIDILGTIQAIIGIFKGNLICTRDCVLEVNASSAYCACRSLCQSIGKELEVIRSG